MFLIPFPLNFMKKALSTKPLGVGKCKNRHLIDVVQALYTHMHVPKCFSRHPSRIGNINTNRHISEPRAKNACHNLITGKIQRLGSERKADWVSEDATNERILVFVPPEYALTPLPNTSHTSTKVNRTKRCSWLNGACAQALPEEEAAPTRTFTIHLRVGLILCQNARSAWEAIRLLLFFAKLYWPNHYGFGPWDTTRDFLEGWTFAVLLHFNTTTACFKLIKLSDPNDSWAMSNLFIT
jgi:hypothetical protein